MIEINEDSNLVKHARAELERIHEESEVVRGYLEMISLFSEMGHSGGSASVFIPTLNALLNFENLAPLTNNPDEWMEVGEGMWQSRRRADAFSEDGGKTYYLLKDGSTASGAKPTYESMDYIPPTSRPFRDAGVMDGELASAETTTAEISSAEKAYIDQTNRRQALEWAISSATANQSIGLNDRVTRDILDRAKEFEKYLQSGE